MAEPKQAGAISADLLEQLYYYALRKTGSKHEAEDLAQDIAMQALGSLARGNRPDEFGRWLWGIARNRYAHWAKARRRRYGADGGSDALALAADDSPSAEERLVRADERAALKREISLLAAGYREIVVAYYYEGQRIADIAAKLGLPEGTVKRRLHDCRLNMREGIEMAREVGMRSFRAEQVSFSKSGPNGKDGSPWNRIDRLIPKNILLAAYRNPMTLEELCLELGVAMPYMEEEVKLLTGVTLLKEVSKGKFETDFIIVDKEMQRRILQVASETGTSFAPLLIELMDAAMPELVRVLGRSCERSDLLWTLVPMAVDFLARQVKHTNGAPEAFTRRPHDGQWDIVGYENFDWPHGLSAGLNGTDVERATMLFYKIGMHDLWDRAGELDAHEVSVLADAIRKGKPLAALGDVERMTIRRLHDRGFVTLNADDISPTFLVLRQDAFGEVSHLLGHPLFSQLHDIMDGYYRSVYAVIGRSVPARLNEQLKFVSGEFLYLLRMLSLKYALDQAHIAIPEEADKSTIAMCMMLN